MAEEPEQPDEPTLGPTLAEWLKARTETEAHVAHVAPAGESAWAQQLADLLATERSWQDQYTELIGLASWNGRFPSSNR
jgi:hypothetical protein